MVKHKRRISLLPGESWSHRDIHHALRFYFRFTIYPYIYAELPWHFLRHFRDGDLFKKSIPSCLFSCPPYYMYVFLHPAGKCLLAGIMA